MKGRSKEPGVNARTSSLADGDGQIGNIAWISLFAGLALAWCPVGMLFLDIWRSKLLGRFGLFLLLALLLSIPFFLLHGLWFGAIVALLGMLHLFLLLFPLIFLLLAYVSREVRALRQAAPAHTRLSFVVVSGMVLTLLGGLLLSLSSMLGFGSPLLFPPAMCGAVIVAILIFFGLFRSRESTQARPKDASPSDLDSSQEPRGYRG